MDKSATARAINTNHFPLGLLELLLEARVLAPVVHGDAAAHDAQDDDAENNDEEDDEAEHHAHLQRRGTV